MAEKENSTETTSPEDQIVRIRGIPWSCSREEILKFFSCSKIKNGLNGIHFMCFRDGRPNGEAYIEMESAEDVEKALKKRLEYIGSRYIEVFTASRAEMNRCIEKSSSSSPGPNSGFNSNSNFDSSEQPQPDDIFIRVRGLPWSCTISDIEKFFQGIGIAPNGIKMPVDRNKKSIGEAYLQFATLSDADKAMTKHKDKIGYRYIEVFRSSFREFSRVNLDADGPPPQPYSYGPPMQNYGGPPPHIQGLYGSRMPPPMMDYGPPPMDRYGWQDDPYQRGVGSRPPPPGPYGGNDYHDQGPEWDKPGPMRSRFPKPHKGPYPDMGKFRSRNGGRMNDQRPPLQQPNQGCPPGPPPSSYNHFIYMRGVPFHFVETDIMDFFSDFTTPIGVNIIYNDYGRPSGEAKVEFRTHNDALNAMKKDRSYLMNNCVELFLCSKDTSNTGYGNNGSHYNTVPERNESEQPSQPQAHPSNTAYGSNYSYESKNEGPMSNYSPYPPKPNHNNGNGNGTNAYGQNGQNANNAGGVGGGGYSYYGKPSGGWHGPSAVGPNNPTQPQQPVSHQPPAAAASQPSTQSYPNYGNSYTNPYLAYSSVPSSQTMYNQGASPVTGYSYSTSNIGHTIKKDPVSY